mmetsp:Transcript_38282/g.94970  ORF Transcript_38282/g.94970 Transcript_38282/m.94970 type:complete len:272 (-) Transcript_38282:131-946(-)|eukprot:CAMPEP_0197592122 /NCGR_PEP_ID=MMETSP1326-20131121/14708_1 /TAXON_ID=1155430 /ORGANISM="Genus nov. species nov., Strain RCC2288" /LENGTH=271 /DNA_ID=CAMNT_0043157773 /DNA_START=141 /DNA_END=956 /DNA_ORIENTATION=-
MASLLTAPAATSRQLGSLSVGQKRAVRKVGVVVRASAQPSEVPSAEPTRRQILSTGLAAAFVGCVPLEARAENNFKNPIALGDGYQRFFGEATSSSTYGGYGGNENNFEKFKYFYDVPEGWQPESPNKTEKSTNGTDSRWSNPKLKDEKVYCVTLAGYKGLKEDRQGILSDLSLSDYNLQDAIIGADSIAVTEREVDGQTYIDFDLYGFFGAIFVVITIYGSRLYAVFSIVPASVLERDVEQGKRLRRSFGTILKDDEQTRYDLEYYKRAT